ncbi:N-acetylmuramoyl-L-alanine amidase [Pseudogracilibacillus auburnensis]|uniref:N-acetylmuramoyl-L-alanine amidase n=1 Tax=Pseudogracilibacillus auburnensis TaxID=1494959 RepID=A0A2V3VWW2_9BACI|nr:N-acetylmuramoyl-L-alanine amidase [Pseudogracilibacillus auburnensis]MBO1003346.1 N-acetylmuramoyl-L-alanine amidase [Pseudogracilibacillus auburnensis]PXW85351.1 N-acetylmuramoyl-L-alanine amidase [Pseudogracilibacillus auburnensis]
MIKIFIDPGHGGSDLGAVGNGLREKDVTLNISKRIRKYVNDHFEGHSIRMSRSDDQTVSLSQRTTLANNWGADVFVSVHVNAGGGTGYEDFIHRSLSNTSSTAKLRDIIHAEIVKQVDWRNRGKKKANFAVLRTSKMSAMLTENGFIDTKADADKLKSSAFLNRIAKGHGEGIAKAFNLKRKSSGSNADSSNPSGSTSNSGSNENSTIKWLGTDQKGRRVESIYRGSDGLNYYDSPRWSNPSGIFNYGQGWIIDNKYVVDGYPMYRVQNSRKQLFWITASSKYVRVI